MTEFIFGSGFVGLGWLERPRHIAPTAGPKGVYAHRCR
jgi:hypothetical protein